MKAEMMPEEQADIDTMIALLEGWDGSLDKDNIAATVYSYTYFFFGNSLFHAYDPTTAKNRAKLLDNYLMENFLIRMIESAANDGDESHFSPICAGGYTEPIGFSVNNVCAYNIAMSFLDVKRFLDENVSLNSDDWKWGNLLVKDWTNLPWSLTSLKPFFHKETPAVGNKNTPNVSRHPVGKNIDNIVFHASNGATYKHIIGFDSDPANEVSLYSIDTGLNENPLQGNYFDMNERHYSNNLF